VNFSRLLLRGLEALEKIDWNRARREAADVRRESRRDRCLLLLRCESPQDLFWRGSVATLTALLR
jgi:hypothetical protein